MMFVLALAVAIIIVNDRILDSEPHVLSVWTCSTETQQRHYTLG